jgi:hypothetical protein
LEFGIYFLEGMALFEAFIILAFKEFFGLWNFSEALLMLIDSNILEELLRLFESCNFVFVDDFKSVINLLVSSVKFTLIVYVICYLPLWFLS